MKKSYIITALLFLASIFGAEARLQMTVTYNDEGTKPALFEITDATVLKVGENASFMLQENGVDLATLKAADIASLKFEYVTTGVENTLVDRLALRLRTNPVENVLSFIGQAPENANLAIYATDGKCVLSVADWQGDDLDVSSLSGGLYVLKINNQIMKFIKL